MVQFLVCLYVCETVRYTGCGVYIVILYICLCHDIIDLCGLIMLVAPSVVSIDHLFILVNCLPVLVLSSFLLYSSKAIQRKVVVVMIDNQLYTQASK